MTTTTTDRPPATTERKRKWDLSADDDKVSPLKPAISVVDSSSAALDPILQAARLNARLAARGIGSGSGTGSHSAVPNGSIYPPLPKDPPPPLPAGPPPARSSSAAASRSDRSFSPQPLPSQADLFIKASISGGLGGGGSAPSSQYAPSLPPPECLPNYDVSVFTRDGEYFIKSLDINDMRNRYSVTREVTRKEIEQEFQCTLQTFGKYYPDRNLATADKEPPLHLRVIAKQKSAMDAAVMRIKELLERPLPSLAEHQQQQLLQQKPQHQRHERKLAIGIDAPSNYPVRAKLVGSAGAFVKHIIQQSGGARVQIRGIGSHYKEPGTDREADEPLFFHITSASEQTVEKAEALCRDLVETVKKDFEQWRQMQQMQHQQQVFGAAQHYYAAAAAAAGYGMPPPLPPAGVYPATAAMPPFPPGASFPPPPPPSSQ